MRTLLGPAAGSQPGSDSVDMLEGAYPWPESGPWTRVLMLRTLDGGVAGSDGRSRSVSSDMDREVLREVRRLADAIVIGAGTMRSERYGPVTSRADAAEERRGLGLATAPVLVVVSGGLDLPWDEPVFAASEQRPIVMTTEHAPTEAVRRAGGHVEVVRLPGERVLAVDLLAALHDRGLRRVVCEGGPGLLESFAAADLVDEVDLTMSPRLPSYGPGPRRAAPGSPEPGRFELAQLLSHESFLFARYVRAGRGRPPTAAASSTRP